MRVTGFARERFNQTTLNGSNSNSAAFRRSIVNCGTASFPRRRRHAAGRRTSTALERYEGMHVTLPQELVIAEYFNYDRFGELVLALPLEGERDRSRRPRSSHPAPPRSRAQRRTP